MADIVCEICGNKLNIKSDSIVCTWCGKKYGLAQINSLLEKAESSAYNKEKAVLSEEQFEKAKAELEKRLYESEKETIVHNTEKKQISSAKQNKSDKIENMLLGSELEDVKCSECGGVLEIKNNYVRCKGCAKKYSFKTIEQLRTLNKETTRAIYGDKKSVKTDDSVERLYAELQKDTVELLPLEETSPNNNIKEENDINAAILHLTEQANKTLNVTNTEKKISASKEVAQKDIKKTVKEDSIKNVKEIVDEKKETIEEKKETTMESKEEKTTMGENTNSISDNTVIRGRAHISSFGNGNNKDNGNGSLFSYSSAKPIRNKVEQEKKQTKTLPVITCEFCGQPVSADLSCQFSSCSGCGKKYLRDRVVELLIKSGYELSDEEKKYVGNTSEKELVINIGFDKVGAQNDLKASEKKEEKKEQNNKVPERDVVAKKENKKETDNENNKAKELAASLSKKLNEAVEALSKEDFKKLSSISEELIELDEKCARAYLYGALSNVTIAGGNTDGERICRRLKKAIELADSREREYVIQMSKYVLCKALSESLSQRGKEFERNAPLNKNKLCNEAIAYINYSNELFNDDNDFTDMFNKRINSMIHSYVGRVQSKAYSKYNESDNKANAYNELCSVTEACSEVLEKISEHHKGFLSEMAQYYVGLAEIQRKIVKYMAPRARR